MSKTQFINYQKLQSTWDKVSLEGRGYYISTQTRIGYGEKKAEWCGYQMFQIQMAVVLFGWQDLS